MTDFELGDWAAVVDNNGTVVLPKRLSFSSMSTHQECGQRWLLEKGYRVGQTYSWWANPGGSAVHEMTEVEDTLFYMRPDGIKVDEFPNWSEIFDRQVEEALEKAGELRASGTKNLKNLSWTGGPNGKDREWWNHFGPLMVAAYRDWRARQADEGWVILAIEHAFEVEMGGQAVVGKIDRVDQNQNTGELRLVDLKTGKDKLDLIQLGTYANGFARSAFMRPTKGAYLRFGYDKAEKRVYAFLAHTTEFDTVNEEYIDKQYRETRMLMEAGVFRPNTSNNCENACSVKEWCRAVGGKQSMLFPVEVTVDLNKKVEDASVSTLPESAAV